MKTDVRMKDVRILFMAALLIVLCASKSYAQCASVLIDSAPDGNGNFHAWTILTDNFTNPGSGCAPQSWTNTGFTHTYTTSLIMISPSGRQAGASNGGSQSGGGGTATVRTDVSLPVDGEFGLFSLSGWDTIVCSFAGLFFNSPVYGSLPPPPIIDGVSDNDTASTTIFAGDSGYLAIYGSALTAWGEDLDPTVTGDDGVTLGTYWASDPQVDASYTVDSQAPLGQHTLALQTKTGRAQGQYNVACPFPASESSQNGQWCQVCTGGIFTVQLLEAGGKAPPKGRYNGRAVNEAISNENDTCGAWAGSIYAQITVPPPPGGPWNVGTINTYGSDLIGDDPAWVSYYRDVINNGVHVYPGGSCSQADTQAMSMKACSGTAMQQYDSHTASITITSSQITATRGNASVSGLAQ